MSIKFGSRLRKYFITGLISILPLWLTAYILFLLFKLVGSLTKPFINPLLELLFEKRLSELLLNLVSFLLTIVLISLIGIFATYLFSRRILQSIENIILNLPGVKGIYIAIKNLVQYFLLPKKRYKSVVLIEYPWNNMYGIGFITSESIKFDICDKVMVSVFIPTSPNPTTGFMVFVEEKKLIRLNITADEAMKIIISGGMIIPDKLKGEQKID